jgi:hypothetical protein
VIDAMLAGVDATEARWKPDDDTWSVLEIVQHLADEEIDDFRPRLFSTLADPDAAWSPIDPEGVARSRRYNDGDLETARSAFAARRAESIARLQALTAPDWTRAHAHPRIGAISAGDLLVSWAAHDALHLRQLARRRFQSTSRDGEGFTTLYAGTW